MTDSKSGRPLSARLLIWLIVGAVAIVALKIALLVVGVAFKLVLFLAFTVVPVLVVGWLVVKGIDHLSKRGRTADEGSAADAGGAL